MKLEQQVCSLALAQQLKTLGMKQESLFTWFGQSHSNISEMKFGIYPSEPKDTVNQQFSAFTVAELGEMFPLEIRAENPNSHITESHFVHFWRFDTGWYIEYTTSKKKKSIMEHCLYYIEAPYEADARAKCLIYLLENKLIYL